MTIASEASLIVFTQSQIFAEKLATMNFAFIFDGRDLDGTCT